MPKLEPGLSRRELLRRAGGYSIAVVSLLSAGCGGSDSKNDQSGLTSFCTNDCSHARDGVCDDGRADATYSECKFGTDCADCGVRYGPASYANQGPIYSNTYSNYSNAYSNYSNYYSNYSNYYSNYSNYSNSSYYNYYNYTSYYNYFVNSW